MDEQKIKRINELYRKSKAEGLTEAEILQRVAQARSCLLKGGEPDVQKAAAFLLDDFRSGRLGRVTLEFPME